MKRILINMVALALVATASTAQLARAEADAPQVTITGTVVSMHHDDFVLATDKGNLKFDMSKDTDRPANLAVGSRVTVSYDSDEKLTSEMEARHVVMAAEA